MSFFAGILGRDKGDDKPAKQPRAQPAIPARRLRPLLVGSFWPDGLREIEETKGFVNFVHIPSVRDISVDTSIQWLRAAREAGINQAIITPDACAFDGERYLGSDRARTSLRDYFGRLRNADVLSMVVGQLTRDEPPQSMEAALTSFCGDLRTVSAEFALQPQRLVVSYKKGIYPALAEHDNAGPDDYDSGDDILGQTLDDFLARLRADQGGILFPGVAVNGAMPERWIAKCADPRIAMLWIFNWGGYEGHDNGLRTDPARAAAWRAALTGIKES